jgi:hypothetical protein
VRAAVANAVSQGIGVVTGMQQRFDWRGVAAAYVGTAAGRAVGSALELPTDGSRGGLESADFLLKSTLKGLAAGVVAAIARGGRVVIQQVAVDSFGNAIGESLAIGDQTDRKTGVPRLSASIRTGITSEDAQILMTAFGELEARGGKVNALFEPGVNDGTMTYTHFDKEHKKITLNALQGSFGRERAMDIYAGSWLADMSQILDPKIVKPGSEFEAKLYRALTNTYKGLFGADMPMPSVDEMRHTNLRHGDNPGTETQALGPVAQHLAETKNYVISKLREAADLGDTKLARVKFGIAIHAIQDFPAHTNVLELYLAKIDSRVQTFTRPVVAGGVSMPQLTSGTFELKHGDVAFSAAGLIADKLFEVGVGPRTPGADPLIKVVLDEYAPAASYLYSWGAEKLALLSDTWIGQQIQPINEWKEKVFNVWANRAIKEAAAIAVELQPESDVPSHSLLAKDRQNHHLHRLSVHVAERLSDDVGAMMKAVWHARSTGRSSEAHEREMNLYVSDLFSHPEQKPNAMIAAEAKYWYDNNARLVPRLYERTLYDHRVRQVQGAIRKAGH